jgi:O-antigen ligase/tetratricopeptide (TPR) repeat protein
MKNNNQTISQNKISSLFFYGICLILFLPIVVLPPAFQPSVWSRVILFRIILTVLISVFLFKFLYKKEFIFSVPKIKNRDYIPFFILLAFFATLILATIFSENIRFSIFSSPNRADGTLNLLFFFGFAIFLTIFAKERQWNKFFNVLFITGISASLLAIVQYFNILKNIFLSYESGGTPSFIGNSTFLAIYMLFLAFLSFTLLTKEKEKKKKIIYAILFFVFIFTILITGSRATYLGLLIGFFFFFFFYPKKFKTLKIIAASLILLAIISILILNFFPQIAEKNNLFKIAERRLSIKNIAEDLAGTRFSVWKITLQAIKDKPLLGWGPENFYIGFEKHYDPTLPNMNKLWWDRPHNIFLDIAVNSGLISLLFYIVFWITLLWQLQKFKRAEGDNKNTYLAHGIQAMFIGYLVALFFNFDGFPTFLTSFFFIGYSFYLISEKTEKTTIYPPQIKILQKKPIFIIFLLFVALFLWFWNIKPLYLNEKINFIANLTRSNKCEEALKITNNENWGKAGIIKSYAALKYSDTIKNCASVYPEKEVEYSKKAFDFLKAGSITQPEYTRTWILMGSLTNVLAAKEKNVDSKNKLLIEARNYLKKAQDLSPERHEIIIEMEKNYLVAEDYKTMKKTGEDCIRIDPDQGECYWYLGIANIFLGDQENGKKYILKSKEKGYYDPPYIQLGVAYISQKNYKDAADAYYSLTSDYKHRKNASYHAVLAFLLKQIGEYEKAGEEALQVFKLQPENKEAQKFLEQLLGLSPNDPTIHSSMAYVYAHIGEEEKAKEELLIVKNLYLQLIARYPQNTTYYFNLAIVYQELGDNEKAKDEVMKVLKIDPTSVEKVEQFLIDLRGDYYKNYLLEKQNK